MQIFSSGRRNCFLFKDIKIEKCINQEDMMSYGGFLASCLHAWKLSNCISMKLKVLCLCIKKYYSFCYSLFARYSKNNTKIIFLVRKRAMKLEIVSDVLNQISTSIFIFFMRKSHNSCK